MKTLIDERQLKLFPDDIEKMCRDEIRKSGDEIRFALYGRVKKLEQQQRDQRRYRWHKALKERGIEVDGPAREIDVSDFASFEDIPVGTRWYVGQLIKIGYNAKYRLL